MVVTQAHTYESIARQRAPCLEDGRFINILR